MKLPSFSFIVIALVFMAAIYFSYTLYEKVAEEGKKSMGEATAVIDKYDAERERKKKRYAPIGEAAKATEAAEAAKEAESARTLLEKKMSESSKRTQEKK